MKSRIMYALVLLLAVFMFVWTGSKEAFFLFAFLLVIIPLMILINYRSANKVSVEAKFIPGTSNVNIEYENKGLLFVFRVEIKLHLVNTYTESEFVFVHSMPLIPRSKKVVTIPLESDFCGRIELHISECKCVDLLGLTGFKVNVKTNASSYIYPELIYDNEEEIIKNARENANSVSNYQNRKGNDITEILNIREYVKGDSVKSIHWKLSMKQKQKLVREFDMPVNQEVLLMFALSENMKNQPAARHIIAQYVFGAAELLYSEQIFFDAPLISNKGLVNIYTIDSEESYEWYLTRLLDGELSFDINDIEYYMSRGNVNKKYSTIIMITDDKVITEDYDEQMGVTHIVADMEQNREQ